MADETEGEVPETTPEEDREAIRVAREQADELLSAIEGASTSAQRRLNEAKSAADEAKGAAERAGTLKAEAEASKAQLDQHASAIEELRKQAKTDREQTSTLAEEADALESDITDKRKVLDELTREVTELSERTESLLPGATSTGLAQAFMRRRTGYTYPRNFYTALTIVSILGLCLVGALGEHGFIEFLQGGPPTWKTILTGIALRLPIAGPLIWLAIYAGRHQILTTRLEEDYAYKEAVSRAFEGYKGQMEDISEGQGVQPVNVLCDNVLRAIGENPGRLFDKKQQDFTPLNAALDDESIQAMAESVGVTPSQVRNVLATLIAMIAQR